MSYLKLRSIHTIEEFRTNEDILYMNAQKIVTYTTLGFRILFGGWMIAKMIRKLRKK